MNIFIVDDNKGMRLLIIHCLREAGFKNHKLIEFDNGLDALNNIEKEKPDLILSDWNMPKMSGLELIKAIKIKVKNNELKKSVPFIFISSESTVEMLNKAKDAGAHGLITKPFSADIFEQKLSPFID